MFLYYLQLYLCLRLNLPGEIVEDGRESASYDVDKGKGMNVCIAVNAIQVM